MFSDDEIKEMPEGTFMKPGDEIISIREVCLDDKFDRRDLGFKSQQVLTNSARSDLEVARSPFRDGFFSESYDQAQFAWTEEDGNIASLVSEPGFGTTGQTTFGKELEAALKNEMNDDESSNRSGSLSAIDLSRKSYSEPQVVSSTSTGNGRRSGVFIEKSKSAQAKVDKADPRTRFHFVKYLNRQGRTVKLWECGICSREFQHQYTLMRHLPTHTDERNFHCDSCGKSFRQLSTLSQHRAIHSADRPYSCEVCRKTFNRVSTLISHRKTHSDQKPYKCHMCPKGFHQKGNLRNHLFTHTNERPYRCDICNKGFNQQSNLVCHKNKSHPNETCGVVNTTVPNSIAARKKTTPRVIHPGPDNQPDSNMPPVERCEVTSSVGPYLPSMEGPSSSNWTPAPTISWETSNAFDSDIWTVNGNGVIVEPINTYHMGVALAMQQTPFALLQPELGPPVLVKVVDTQLPGGKQMLVPATAEDLRSGGKIIMKNESDTAQYTPANEQVNRAVQIRVPVVATVVPKVRPGGRLHLAVLEPHHAYTALSADIGEVHVEPCTLRESREVARERQKHSRPEVLRRLDSATQPPPLVTSFPEMRPGSSISSCALSSPAPSPPLDLISMDLFEPMECIVPMGPQITAVGNIGPAPPSDDSDIFIGQFEESIALSDSD